MKKARFLFLLVCLLFLWGSPEVLAQCAMCKATATSNLEGGGNIAKGINMGILYLMAVPYLIVLLVFRKQLAGLFKMLRGKASR